MTIQETKQELIDAGNSLIKAASADSSEQKYFIEEVGREMIKLAGEIRDNITEEEVNAMQVLEKSAAVASTGSRILGSLASLRRGVPFMESAQRAAGAGVVGLGLGLATLAAMKAANKVGEVRDYNKYRGALEAAYKDNELLESVPEEKIRSIGESVYRFAPNASKDPNLMRNILNSYAATGLDSGLDGPTVRMLTEIEDRLTRRNQTSISGISLRG